MLSLQITFCEKLAITGKLKDSPQSDDVGKWFTWALTFIVTSCLLPIVD